MDFQLFETKLANHKIFKDIKESLKDNSDGKLRNLIELKDEVLYIWNSIENCLYSVNLKRLEEDAEETPYQKLHLVSPPAFAVDRIIGSECGSRLCLWGSRGVMVLELPSRWNRGGLFDSGSKTVLCKSATLDERFLYSQGEIHRVHWHPKSLSHILVLVSDNTMRLYNIALKTGPKLVKIFTIGPKPSGVLGQTVLDSLGDTAVDFTPTPDNEYLLVLSGNGDVYMMECELDIKSTIRAKLRGPLAMYPPADDNYGSESCSITALGGVDTPPLVVIASASAALYHCLLLPNSVDKKEDDGFALYVVESVELNIVLNSEETPSNYVYPVHLYPAGRGAYVCVHAGGAHTVCVPPAAALAEYAAAGDDEMETALQSICSKQSSARHLICSGRSPPLGLALTTPPLQRLLILCAGGDLLTRALGPYDIEEQLYKEIQLKNTALEQDDINIILKERVPEEETDMKSVKNDMTKKEISEMMYHRTANKSATLDERFLYSQGEIHRVHWHPKSLSHILVLVSDNTMRLYNIALKTGPKLVKIFTIGPKPSGVLGQTVLDSLGDTAVDFTPTPDNEYLLVLSGNGDVYMMECELDIKSTIRAKLRGPLAMYPPADDNYGSESCSITALGGVDTPPLVVIASASAALYHCLLLPNSVDKKEDDGFALYVVESVELNIVLNSEETPSNYVYPVHLYPAGRGAYVCVHAGGAHTVCVPPAAALAEYAAAGDDEMETALQSICSKQSSARHLICSGRSPPLGLALTTPPLQRLLILCAGGDLLTRALGPYDIEEQLYKEIQLKNTALEQDDINIILKEKQKISFSHIIHEVLDRKVSQPILKLEDTPGTQQSLELLTQATVKLRGEYILKQQRACDVITRKMAALGAIAHQHREWLQELQKEIEDVKNTTAVIKEKWALAEKHQDDIKFRCSSVFRSVRAGRGTSAAELEQLQQLQEFRRRTGELVRRLADTKDLLRGDALQKKKFQEEYSKKNTVLGKSHSDSISSILQQQTIQISSIIEETKILKDQLGVV